MSYLRHIEQCNLHQPDHFLTLKVNNITVGRVKHKFADLLQTHSTQFSLNKNVIHWDMPADSFETRNRVMLELTEQLQNSGVLPGFHNELYPVTADKREEVLFLIDRAMAPYFGISAYGQHMNGFCRRHGEIHMWIARRSKQKSHAPGKLDNLVAGGLPYGLSLQENLAKECWEEAGIKSELAVKAQSTGHIAYRCETEAGFKPDTMYCYDLELPEDFTPRCTDGEVEEFYCWPMEKVARLVHDSDEFKLNCNMVIIDFLIRHDYIQKGHPEYEKLVNGLQ